MVIVVKTHPMHSQHLGKILQITMPAPFPDEWLTEPELRCTKTNHLLSVKEPYVKKIEDPGDDATDETLEWLPVPNKQEEFV